MKPQARKEELVIQEVGGETLVYDLKTNKAICLNQTSALVWQNCDGKKDVLEISKDMETQLGSKVSEDFVWFAVNQLEKENLLVEKEDKFYKFDGLSRREVIKKIGLASVIALPLISTIVTPTAANAASMVASGGACSLSSQCASGCCQLTGNGANTCKTNNGNCI